MTDENLTTLGYGDRNTYVSIVNTILLFATLSLGHILDVRSMKLFVLKIDQNVTLLANQK
jgi:hypothetical protein